MTTILMRYHDENGNSIIYDGGENPNITVNFKGAGNTLIVKSAVRSKKLLVSFLCNNAKCVLGNTSIDGHLGLGEDCQITVGDGVTTTTGCYISTAEGSKVHLGDDVMIASGVQIRSDDAHAIYDVTTGHRINDPKDIHVGNHVWIGFDALLLGGARIGDGSVIGAKSVLKDTVPNNAIAAGSPARVVRKNIAWERPHLNLSKPFYKPKPIKKSEYWCRTETLPPVEIIASSERMRESRRSIKKRMVNFIKKMIRR